eukprot:g7862.t1
MTVPCLQIHVRVINVLDMVFVLLQKIIPNLIVSAQMGIVVQLVLLNLTHATCEIAMEVRASFSLLLQGTNAYARLNGPDYRVQNVQVGIMVPTANINVPVEPQIFAMGMVLARMENPIAVLVLAMVVIPEIHVVLHQINVTICLQGVARQLLGVGGVYQVIGVVIVAHTKQVAPILANEPATQMQTTATKGGIRGED